jgi:hypothetical protein
MAETLLPSAFAELEEFAQLWCLPTETQRWERRVNSSMADMEHFYNAFFPRLEEAIEYCDKFSLDELPQDATNLLHLIYSLIMVAMSVEIMHQPRPVDACDAEMIRVSEPRP